MSDHKKTVIHSLEQLLADTYVVYLKTHGYHWNVVGPMFSSLHGLFMTQYSELALAVDEIAERIRALGAPAPGSYAQFLKRATVKEAIGVPSATEMIRDLVADQEAITASAQGLVKAAEAAGDDASVDLGVRRIQLHEKSAWMLRSHLE